jgi:hypothetical protein
MIVSPLLKLGLLPFHPFLKSSNSVATLLRNVEEESGAPAKLWGYWIDLWPSPQIWSDEATTPVSYLAEQKERIAAPEGLECFNAHPSDPDHICFGPGL